VQGYFKIKLKSGVVNRVYKMILTINMTTTTQNTFMDISKHIRYIYSNVILI